MNQNTVNSSLVSVIIPSYNSGEFLAEAIKSVVDQTYAFIEILIVDDGSTDGIGRLVGDWQKKTNKISYLKHDVNKGLSAARNTGIKNARGEYIAFLDADDVWLPEKIACQLQEINRLKVDLIFSNWFVWEQDKKEKAIDVDHLLIFSGTKGVRAFIGKNYGNSSTVLMKSSVLRNISLFDESLNSSEDYDLWLRLLLRGTDMAFIPEVLACYRQHPVQMSARTYTMRISRLVVFKKLIRSNPLLLVGCPVLLKKVFLHQSYQILHKILAFVGLTGAAGSDVLKVARRN